MNRLRTALAVAALLSSACFKVTVVTTPSAANSTDAATVSQPWSNGFIFGLVPPAPLNVAQSCPGGAVTKVVTQHSFLNVLATGLTFQLYTPMQLDVWCGGGRSSSLGLPPQLLGAPAEAPAPTPAPQP